MDIDEIFVDIQAQISREKFKLDAILNELKELKLDSSIAANMAFSFGISLLMILAYWFLRAKIKQVYKPRTLFSSPKTGFFTFATVLVSISEDKLINYIGIDGFIFLETLKFLFSLLFFLLVFAIPFVIVPICFTQTIDKNHIFVSLSIVNMKKGSRIYWVIVILSWMFSLYSLNALESFCRRFIELRQKFLTKPSSLHAIDFIESVKVAQKIYSYQQPGLGTSSEIQQEMFDEATQTIVAKRLPCGVTNNDKLMEYAVGLNLGTVKSVTFVEDCTDFLSLLNKKRQVVLNLEDAYAKLLTSVAKKIKLSLQQTNPEANQDVSMWCSSFYQYSSLSQQEKEDLLDRINGDITDLEENRPTRSFLGCFSPLGPGSRDSILYSLQELDKLDSALIRMKQNYEELLLAEQSQDAQQAVQDQAALAKPEEAFYSRYISLGPMVIYPPAAIIKPIAKSVHFRKAAIITYSSSYEASMSKQCLLEEEVINTKFIPAPCPYDISWYNLKDLCTKRYLKLFYKFMYLAIVLFWSVPTSIISVLTEIEFLDSITTQFFGKSISQWPKLRSVWVGFIAPKALTALSAFVPYMLINLAIKQGYICRSKILYTSARMYTWFLFIQPFLFTLTSSSFLTSLETIMKGGYTRVMIDFQETILKKSSFFFNIIMQRFSFDMAFAILAPTELIFRWALYSKVSSPRRSTGTVLPSNFPFSSALPKAVSIFPITMLYGFMSPVILFAGMVFYLVAYVVHCYQFLNVYTCAAESGGMYWKVNFQIIHASIALCSLSTVIQLLLAQSFKQAFLLIPSFIFIIFRGGKIKERYWPYFEVKPLKERIHPNVFPEQAELTRNDIIQQTGIDTCDRPAEDFLLAESIFLSQKVNQREIASEYFVRWLFLSNYYSCPITFPTRCDIYFPDHFFEIFKYYYEVFLTSSPTDPTQQQSSGRSANIETTRDGSAI